MNFVSIVHFYRLCLSRVLIFAPEASKYLFSAIVPEFSSQSDCRMHMHLRTSENIVLQALMDEHQENRDLQNLTSEILNREKVRLLDKILYW